MAGTKNRCAVVGVGQTKYETTAGDLSLAGLVRQAAYRALEDAEMGWDDIDAVVIGKAPDFFEGVMMPEIYLAEALGCVGKPIMRVHTAGSVGGSASLTALTVSSTTGVEFAGAVTVDIDIDVDTDGAVNVNGPMLAGGSVTLAGGDDVTVTVTGSIDAATAELDSDDQCGVLRMPNTVTGGSKDEPRRLSQPRYHPSE